MTAKPYLPQKQPFFAEKDKEQLRECFIEEMKKADKLIITVAFSSSYSLYRLDKLVEKYNIKNICVILGMYYFVEPLEQLYTLAMNINAKWQEAGIGEIKIVHSFRYHGKIYCFIKDNQIFSAIFGSPNLSFLHQPKKDWEEQFETALLIRDPETLKDFFKHTEEMKSANCSDNISNFKCSRILWIQNTPWGKIKDYKIKLTKHL